MVWTWGVIDGGGGPETTNKTGAYSSADVTLGKLGAVPSTELTVLSSAAACSAHCHA